MSIYNKDIGKSEVIYTKDELRFMSLAVKVLKLDSDKQAIATGFMLALLGQADINQPFTFSQSPQPQPAAV